MLLYLPRYICYPSLHKDFVKKTGGYPDDNFRKKREKKGKYILKNTSPLATSSGDNMFAVSSAFRIKVKQSALLMQNCKYISLFFLGIKV